MTVMDDVQEATSDDLRGAVRNACARSGFTFGELAEQAKARDFATMRAKLAWVAIGDLGEYADD